MHHLIQVGKRIPRNLNWYQGVLPRVWLALRRGMLRGCLGERPKLFLFSWMAKP